jgi:hypothetical protein
VSSDTSFERRCTTRHAAPVISTLGVVAALTNNYFRPDPAAHFVRSSHILTGTGWPIWHMDCWLPGSLVLAATGTIQGRTVAVLHGGSVAYVFSLAAVLWLLTRHLPRNWSYRNVSFSSSRCHPALLYATRLLSLRTAASINVWFLYSCNFVLQCSFSSWEGG